MSDDANVVISFWPIYMYLEHLVGNKEMCNAFHIPCSVTSCQFWTFIPLHSSIKSSPMPIKPEERFDLFWGWKRCQASFYCCFSHGQQRRHFASLLQVFKWRWVQKSFALGECMAWSWSSATGWKCTQAFSILSKHHFHRHPHFNHLHHNHDP